MVTDDYPYFISSDWSEPYRAQRITELIETMSKGSERISLDDVAAIHGDQSSSEVQRTLPLLLKIAAKDERQQSTLDLLTQWDRRSSLDSVAASIYEAWIIDKSNVRG